VRSLIGGVRVEIIMPVNYNWRSEKLEKGIIICGIIMRVQGMYCTASGGMNIIMVEGHYNSWDLPQNIVGTL
jgi:hypothetical protein